MKAWVVENHGGSDALLWKDVANPVVKAGEVRVKVQAVGLNHLDVWVRKGVHGHRFPLPMIPGCDVAGIVDDSGPGCPPFKKGTPVLIQPLLCCGRCEACLSGFQPICRDFGMIGETRDGGCAEYISVPANNIIPLPEGLSPVEAAALPIPFVTAWSMLTRKVRIVPGDFILIQAGGSGVSVAAIQIAKLLGATVITTVGDDSKVSKVVALGADHVIQYRKSILLDELKAILKKHNRRGVDVVLDHVGLDTFNSSLKALKWGGHLVTCGATTGSDVQIDLKAVFFKNLTIHGSTMGSQADLIRILDLVSTGKLRPVLDSVFPILDYPKALERIENRSVFGKLVCSF